MLGQTIFYLIRRNGRSVRGQSELGAAKSDVILVARITGGK